MVFLPSGGNTTYGAGYTAEGDPAKYYQEIFGADLEYSIGHLDFYAEGFHNRWAYADVYGADLKATGASAEIRYVPATRYSVALRVGGVFFNRIHATVYGPLYLPVFYDGTWDRDVFRIEGAAGYRIARNVLLKLVYP